MADVEQVQAVQQYRIANIAMTISLNFVQDRPSERRCCIRGKQSQGGLVGYMAADKLQAKHFSAYSCSTTHLKV